MSQSVEVCIIGAGVSGLKAAQHLIKNSKYSAEDIVILEAQDRIGGRLYTDRTSSKLGYSYDLGASWFHDCLTNVLFQHFYSGEDNDVFDISKDGYFDDKPECMFEKDLTGPVSEAKTKVGTIIHDIEKFIELYFLEHLSLEEDKSVKEMVDLYLLKYSKLLTEEEIKYAKVAMRYVELWHGVSWDKLSARYSILQHQGRNLFNAKGYDVIIDWLLKDIPRERILLESPVSKINRHVSNSDKRISVETKNGTVIHCNYLVVSVPLSILSLESSSDYGITWEPPLPETMTAALQKIHFGGLGKVVFEFDSIWWDMNQDRFSMIPKLTQSNEIFEELTSLPEPWSYPATAINYSAVRSKQDGTAAKGGSLVILTQSPLSNYLEKHPHEAWTYFKPMLSKIAVKEMPNEPITTITTEWSSNPYIRGAYGTIFTGDDPVNASIQLSGQVPGAGISSSTIRFAGEHTATEGEGCVNGAWMSGEREANWIMEHAGKSLKPLL